MLECFYRASTNLGQYGFPLKTCGNDTSGMFIADGVILAFRIMDGSKWHAVKAYLAVQYGYESLEIECTQIFTDIIRFFT